MACKRLGSVLLLSVALAAGAAGAYPDPGETVRAEAFIKTALDGIGASTTDCPAAVVRETASREMLVRCARFEGDFTAFRDLWAEWTVGAEPRGGWSVTGVGLNYDRVYAVGESAVGVRFTRGEILVVLK